MRSKTWKLSVISLLGLLAFGSAQTALAGDVRLRARIESTGHPTQVDPNGDGETGVFTVEHARTNLGPATSENWSKFLPWDGVSFCGPTHVLRVWRFLESSMLFEDGSRLFTVLKSGTLCVNYVAFTFEGSGELEVVGGTGRFAGATGTLSFEIRSELYFGNGLVASRTTVNGVVRTR